MSRNTRAGLISALASVLAAIVYVEAQPVLAALAGQHLTPWLAAARPFLVPAVGYASGWAAHFLLTKDASPPLPPGLEPRTGTPPPHAPSP